MEERLLHIKPKRCMHVSKLNKKKINKKKSSQLGSLRSMTGGDITNKINCSLASIDDFRYLPLSAYRPSHTLRDCSPAMGSYKVPQSGMLCNVNSNMFNILLLIFGISQLFVLKLAKRVSALA